MFSLTLLFRAPRGRANGAGRGAPWGADQAPTGAQGEAGALAGDDVESPG